MQVVNSTRIYCKNFGKCHDVSLITTIIKIEINNKDTCIDIGNFRLVK
jgi:hypothetical protein